MTMPPSLRRDWQVGFATTAALHAVVLILLIVRFYVAEPFVPAPPSLAIEMVNSPPAPVVQPHVAPPKPQDRPKPPPVTPDVPPVPQGRDPIPLPVPPKAKDTPQTPAPTRPDHPITPPPASAVAQAERNRVASDTDANPHAQETWESAVVAQLEGAKRYPASARFAHQQATIYARFVVNRQGGVVRADLVKSSGYPDLDSEVRSLFRRVRLPPPPATIPDLALTMTVPIEFTLDQP